MVSRFWKKSKSLPAVLMIGSLLVTSGCGKGTGKNVKIEGINGPNVAFVNNTLLMSVVFTQLRIDGGITLPIPHMPNSFVEIGPDLQSNGYMLQIGVNSADLVALAGNSINLLDPQTLPGGRPLPGVIAGQLPALAIEVPKLNNVVFYVGPSVLGSFIPVNLPWNSIIGTFRFYDSKGSSIGNLSIVGQDPNKKNAGILLLIDIGAGSAVGSLLPKPKG